MTEWVWEKSADRSSRFALGTVGENERHIAAQVAGRPLTILAAWGALVESRPYLLRLAYDIAALPELQACTWVSLGTPTKKGHPRHPLYVKGTTPFDPFDIAPYSKQ